MDKEIIIDKLKHKNEILPNEFDGTYRSVHEAMEFYAKVRKIALIDCNDLELMYYLSLGLWKNDKKELKYYIQKSHLLHNDKLLLEKKLEKIWSKGSRMLFGHVIEKLEMDFLTAPVSFKELPVAKNAESIQFFFKMCINLSGLENDGKLFDTAQQMLNSRIKNSGLPVSRILHCLKPFTFPILDESVTDSIVFRSIDIGVCAIDDISQYITNCRKILDFRNSIFKFHYRLYYFISQ